LPVTGSLSRLAVQDVPNQQQANRIECQTHAVSLSPRDGPVTYLRPALARSPNPLRFSGIQYLGTTGINDFEVVAFLIVLPELS